MPINKILYSWNMINFHIEIVFYSNPKRLIKKNIRTHYLSQYLHRIKLQLIEKKVITDSFIGQREIARNKTNFFLTTLQNIHTIPLSSHFFFFFFRPLNPTLLKFSRIDRFLKSRERERDLHKAASKSHPRQCRRGSGRGTNLNEWARVDR